MIQNFMDIDKDLNDILNGGAKKAPKLKSKKLPSKKSSKKLPKKSSKKISKKQTKFVEAGSIIASDSANNNTTVIKPEYSVISNQTSPKKVRPQKRLEINADLNKEYISVKTEKPSKKDNTYKSYDIAFLKRLQRSKIESNTTEDEDN